MYFAYTVTSDKVTSLREIKETNHNNQAEQHNHFVKTFKLVQLELNSLLFAVILR